MKHFLIMVEGVHDLAVVDKMLKLQGIHKKIVSRPEVLPVWDDLIPKAYPFHGDNLELIAPIPSIRQSCYLSVATVSCGGDTKIAKRLIQFIANTRVQFLSQLTHILIILDADAGISAERCRTIISEICNSGKENGISADNDVLAYENIKIPLTVYIFPDGTTQGNLEDLLMRAAQIRYPNELQLSREYNDAVKEFQKALRSDSAYKKSVIGCIANTMRPGRANQVSIGQDEWVTEKTVKDVTGFHQLYKIIAGVCDGLTGI